MENDKYLGKKLEGRYEIQELVGMGGMSNVYKAYDTIDQRLVAVKILRDEYLGNEEFLRRFKNESKAIAVLSHPNIVRVYDVSFTNRVHSIVMEFIDGITLKDYIERQGVLSWKEAVHFTLQILHALQHAHGKGIVHRDIKPQNIMLLQNGTIKVTDFGIARFARSEVQTITDRAIGSVHYISPEQAMGDNTDQKTDIYSVGVLMFEMLTGRLPFEAETAVSVAIKQIQSQAVRPTELNPSIPAGLEDIIVRAMQKDPLQRYQTATEMIEDIETFKQDPSIQFQYKYLDNTNPQAQKKRYKKAINETREEEQMQRKRRRTPYIPILTGVTFAFVLASLAFIGLMIWLNNPFTKVPEIEVPNMVGMKFDTAKNQYTDFEIVQESIVNNDEYGSGVIFEQTPRAGRKIREGTSVTVKVSSGQRIVTLEDYMHRPADTVIQKLTDMGLQYEQKYIYSDDVTKDSVVYTDPSKDSEVGSGTTVTVYISLGRDEVWKNVPDLKGLTLERARQLLEQNNMRMGNVTYEAREEPANTIVAQNPDSGGLQVEGTAVDVIVSKGREGNFKRVAINVPLPDVDRVITIRAYVDNELKAEESLNPSEDPNWKPWFEGEDTIVIDIFIDGQFYQRYGLDFTSEPARFYPISLSGSSSNEDDDPERGSSIFDDE